MSSLITLLWFAIPLLIGYGFGTWLERRHYASIRAREAAMIDKTLVFNIPTLPVMAGSPQLRLVSGSTVVSVDAFKRFAARLHALVGGRITAYESLVDRARREAMLRMREKAHELGASMVFGVRLETSSINGGNPNLTMGIELIAYGTAVIPDTTATGQSAPWGSRA